MNYAMAMNYIEEKNRLGIVPGLENIKELLRRLGNPQDMCRCLHIAGTNGKGSIFAFVQQGLIQAGFRVGRYISPTIFTYLERFQINETYMTEEMFAELLTVVAEQVQAMEQEGFASPTAFEIETAVAFLYFMKQQVDYVLVECGMGGRLDGTNVISCAQVTVMAPISRDHMQFLGDTLEQIATEKAGIIHRGTVCISAPQKNAVKSVLKKTCEELAVPYREVPVSAVLDWNLEPGGSKFTMGSLTGENTVSEPVETFEISLLGEHQIWNAATAVYVLRELGISKQDIRRGLSLARWSGRLTRVCEAPDVYVDGAHNEAAWKYLRKAVNKYFTNRRIVYIIGVLKDKEYNKMLELLAPTMSYAITVTPDTPRALDRDTLATLIRGYDVACVSAATAEEAMKIAREHAGEQDVILVCGSLSFIADYLMMK